MGLDAVEFLMEVEDRFSVSLPDEDVFYFQTLGQLHDYLVDKITGRRRSDCPTRLAFYRLRRTMARMFDMSRRELRPKSKLLPLLGTWRRGEKWDRLELELGLMLPPLVNRTDAGVCIGAAMAAATTFVLVIMFSGDPFHAIAAATFSLLPGVLLGFCLGLLCLPTVDVQFQTLGGLTRCIVALNHKEFQTSDKSSTDNDPIWDSLCEIVVDQLGVKREFLNRDTRFVEDLFR
ncbi:MAG: hypothetical protein JW719_08885 [Pirellulales bacterium]|nr:hypothetical protein [Pirellulales bacterium]